MDLKSAGSSPAFPNIQYNSFAYVINHLNIAATRKKPKIKILITRKTLTLINTLYRIGCVQRFLLATEHLKGRRVRFAYVSTPFYKQTPYFKSVRLVSTPSKRHTISLKSLRTVAASIRSSIIILSTPYGVVNHSEALRLRTGGLILCFIN